MQDLCQVACALRMAVMRFCRLSRSGHTVADLQHSGGGGPKFVLAGAEMALRKFYANSRHPYLLPTLENKSVDMVDRMV
jgi:hypothetical protein